MELEKIYRDQNCGYFFIDDNFKRYGEDKLINRYFFKYWHNYMYSNLVYGIEIKE